MTEAGDELGEAVPLGLRWFVLEENREVPIAVGVGFRARAKQHDPLDAARELS